MKISIEIIIKILIGIVLGFLFFLLINAEARIYFKKYFYSIVYPPILKVSQLNDLDESIGWKTKKNLHLVQFLNNKKFLIITNDEGSRISSKQSINKKKYEEKKIIYTIGGSQSFGWGVENSKTFSYLFSDKINRFSKNFSINGVGTVASFLIGKEKIKDKNAIVLYGLWADHLNRNISPCLNSGIPICFPQPFVNMKEKKIKIIPGSIKAFEDEVLFYNSKLYGASEEKIKSIKYWNDSSENRKKIEKKYLSKFLDDKIYKENSLLFVLEKLNNLVQKKDSKLFIIYIPNYLNFNDMKPISKKLSLYFSKENIVLIDMYDVFKKEIENGKKIRLDDGHMNEYAHKLVFNELYKHYLKFK